MRSGAVLLLLCCTICCAQDSSTPRPQKPPAPAKKTKPAPPRPASLVPQQFAGNFAYDQKVLWTGPFRARIQDLNWLVPAIGMAAGLINADSELSSRIDPAGSLARNSKTLSNAGLGVAVAGAGSLYFFGRARSDDHQRETGILSGEAALNGVVITEVLKLATQRERPNDGTGQGRFWHGGTFNSSFPSEHAVVAWSIASVVAHEYSGPLTKFLAYGLAAGVSTTRVTGRAHFTSDVFVGSTLGWLIGRQVFNAHHDQENLSAIYGTFTRTAPSEPMSAASMSSPYVPMDSWVYPAFDRLAALGAIPSGFLGMKPWTRAECARLLDESSRYADDLSGDEASRLIKVLETEFSPELGGMRPYLALDSVYARATGISGQPLTDSYHFAQTIVNDYGRPFQEGFNYVNGVSASGSSGPLGFAFRGEYEHAPSAPGVSQSVLNAILTTDQKPLGQVAAPVQAFNQFRLLDTYVMLNLRGWQASFGKQTLWTSPTQDPFLMSDNAEPVYMFHIDQTTPRVLPSIFRFLGPYRAEFFVGKLTGHHYANTPLHGTAVALGRTLERQPMINGVKVNFKPTPNFEFGVGKTGVFGGPDFPLTLHSLGRSLFSSRNASGIDDPGDRRSTFDFSYRIPGLRNWLTLYDDSFVEDEFSPIGYPRRAAQDAGIYMPQLPRLHSMDFRFEGSYDNLPNLIQPPFGGFFYWNIRYLDGYTNQGNIIGNGTLGRQGIAFRAASTWWFGADRNVQIGYRNMTADNSFLQGGNLRDVQIRSEWALNKAVSISSFGQYEWWNFPLLSAGNRTTNFTASFQVTWHPRRRVTGGE